MPKGNAGFFALDPATGEQQWYAAAPKVPCSYSGRCLIGQSAAPPEVFGRHGLQRIGV